MDIGIPRVFSIIIDNFYHRQGPSSDIRRSAPNTATADAAGNAAPAICDDLELLNSCIDQLCDGFKSGAKRRSESDIALLKEALRFVQGFWDHKWISTRALVYKTVDVYRDQFCDGEPFAITEPVVQEVAETDAASVHAAQQRNIFIVGVGALGILALRIAILHPSMRSASPALIEGVYMWMGLPGVNVMDFEGMYGRDHSDLL